MTMCVYVDVLFCIPWMPFDFDVVFFRLRFYIHSVNATTKIMREREKNHIDLFSVCVCVLQSATMVYFVTNNIWIFPSNQHLSQYLCLCVCAIFFFEIKRRDQYILVSFIFYFVQFHMILTLTYIKKEMTFIANETKREKKMGTLKNWIHDRSQNLDEENLN